QSAATPKTVSDIRPTLDERSEALGGTPAALPAARCPQDVSTGKGWALQCGWRKGARAGERADGARRPMHNFRNAAGSQVCKEAVGHRHEHPQAGFVALGGSC